MQESKKMSVARFHLFRFIVVVTISLFTATFFGFWGWLLGKWLDYRSPILTFVFVFLSFPITQFVLYKVMRHMGKKFLTK